MDRPASPVNCNELTDPVLLKEIGVRVEDRLARRIVQLFGIVVFATGQLLELRK